MGRAEGTREPVDHRIYKGSYLAVCDQCVGDPYLAELVQARGEQCQCDYCEQQPPRQVAAPFEVVLEVIHQTVGLDPAAATWPSHAAESGLDDGIAIDAVLEGLQPTASRAFWGAVAFSLKPRQASAAVYADRPVRSSLRLASEDPWLDFAQQMPEDLEFWQPAPHVPDTSAARIEALLEEIGQAAERLGFICVLREGTRVARVRVRRQGAEWTADHDAMGAPPDGCPTAGRIGLAGTRHFHGALEIETAIAEMATAPPVRLVAGAFELRREARVLDLRRLQSEYSARERAHPQDVLVRRFLAGLAQAISPIVRSDGAEVAACRPSRIVCDWLARRCRMFGDGRAPARLDGLVYPSVVAPGGHNLVFFASDDGAAPGKDRIEFLSSYELALDTWDELAEALGYGSRVGAVPR